MGFVALGSKGGLPVSPGEPQRHSRFCRSDLPSAGLYGYVLAGHLQRTFPSLLIFLSVPFSSLASFSQRRRRRVVPVTPLFCTALPLQASAIFPHVLLAKRLPTATAGTINLMVRPGTGASRYLYLANGHCTVVSPQRDGTNSAFGGRNGYHNSGLDVMSHSR